MAAVFAMQGFGQLFASIISLIMIVAFKKAYVNIADEAACGEQCRAAADRSWRIIVGLGAIPACFALYYRITLPETPRYTFDIAHDVEKADADIKAYVSKNPRSGQYDKKRRSRVYLERNLEIPRASWSDLANYLEDWRNFRVLLGTTLSWFFIVNIHSSSIHPFNVSSTNNSFVSHTHADRGWSNSLTLLLFLS